MVTPLAIKVIVERAADAREREVKRGIKDKEDGDAPTTLNAVAGPFRAIQGL